MKCNELVYTCRRDSYNEIILKFKVNNYHLNNRNTKQEWNIS